MNRFTMPSRPSLTGALLSLSLLSLPLARAEIEITEFLAINDSVLADEDGDYSDWIEIRNAGDTAVDLQGYQLTDDPEFQLSETDSYWRFPARVLAPSEYVLLFASGKNRAGDGELHTDFALGPEEYLALVSPDGRTKLSEFGPGYTRQRTDISYGVAGGSPGDLHFFTSPTPGEPNQNNGILGFVADTKFSVDRGLFADAFELVISTATEGAQILYTTDGRTPSKGSIFSGPVGDYYTGPISLSTTSIIRAMAMKDGYESTNVDTQTYIFIEDVIEQGPEHEGWPTEWLGNGGTGTLPADYEMDPEVTQDPAYQDIMDDALTALPILSLVTDPEHLFSTKDGIYQRPQQSGPEWERPVSVEWIDPDGSEGFHINAGLRIQGGHTREPAKSPKHSFRLLFKKVYGEAKLRYRLFPEATAVDEFDTLILRGGGNQSWMHHNEFEGDNRGRAQYVRDQWAKDSQIAMGHPGAHNRMVHLYINGLYWGLYNPTERPTAPFGECYLGGRAEEYDALNSGEVKDGNKEAFDEFFARARRDLTVGANYDAVAEVLDIGAFTDYIILNQYGGNIDWDHHNWYALANRNGGKWYFCAWDSEFFFTRLEDNVVGKRNTGNPSEIFLALIENENYKRYFADRVHQVLFNDGPLSLPAVLARWEKRSADVELAIVAESARWGDYRRDVHRRAGPYALMTRDEHWMAERNRLLNDYFPERHEVLIDQYRRAGYYPQRTGAPVFDRHGGDITAVAEISVSVAGSIFAPRGTVYVTVDGSDPRMPDGEPNPEAVALDAEGANSVLLEASGIVKARHLADEEWSVLTQAYFVKGVPASRANLVVSEVHSRPGTPSPDEDPEGLFAAKDFEFLELRNTSRTESVDLSGLSFSDGIDHAWPANEAALLGPGAYGLLVANQAAFRARYPEVSIGSILGEFQNLTNLKNGGEALTLRGAYGEIIFDFRYDDGNDWPALDAGHALVFEGSDPADPSQWSSSRAVGGSPGEAEPEVTGQTYADWQIEHFTESERAEAGISGLTADPDGDGLGNWAEYGFAGNPNMPTRTDEVVKAPVLSREDGSVELRFSYRRNAIASDAIFKVQWSTDLQSWTDADVVTETSVVPTAREAGVWVTAEIALPADRSARYLRVQVEPK